jgi:prepilin-type N-terminal cleavage/methylation domain-containing protein
MNPHRSRSSRHRSPRPNPGVSAFSLIEVLIAIFILGIGLLMIAAIFPVGGNWTRQSAEETVAQSVARSAVSLIQRRYAQSGDGSDTLANASGQIAQTLASLPGFTDIPPTERSFQFGASVPFPSQQPAQCTYFWTALVRKSPSPTSDGRSIDLYVLVFHKGSVEQIFSSPTSEVPGVRLGGELYIPTVSTIPAAQPDAVRVGEYALGEESGTIYRRIVSTSGQPAFQPPLVSDNDVLIDSNLLISPPADGTAASSLVYVYQTTLSF